MHIIVVHVMDLCSKSAIASMLRAIANKILFVLSLLRSLFSHIQTQTRQGPTTCSETRGVSLIVCLIHPTPTTWTPLSESVTADASCQSDRACLSVFSKAPAAFVKAKLRTRITQLFFLSYTNIILTTVKVLKCVS